MLIGSVRLAAAAGAPLLCAALVMAPAARAAAAARAVVAPAAAPGPAPVPPQAAQDDALKLVKDVFKDEYARRAPEDRSALAQRLVTQAGEEAAASAKRYV